MNPLAQQALGAIIRFALGGLFGVLVERGIWTKEDAATYLGAAVVAVLTLGWSLWVKYKGRLKLLTALAHDAPMSEKTVEVMVANNQAPPATTPKHETPELPA